MSTDPYAWCGLLGNPFVAEPAQPWTEPGWAERTPAEPPAPGQGLLIQFVGVKGAGKSTTLNRFRSRSPGPHRYVPPGPGRWRPLPVAPLVYWDELDRSPAGLRWAGWLRAARIRATVVAGTHVDLAAEAGRAGLRVRTVVLPPITVAELTAWAEARLAGARSTRALRPEIPGAGTQSAGNESAGNESTRNESAGNESPAGAGLTGDQVTESCSDDGRPRAGDFGVDWALPSAEAERIVTEAGASWRRAADLMHIWVADEVARRTSTLEVGYAEEGPHGR